MIVVRKASKFAAVPAIAALLAAGTPALAQKAPPVTLTKCETSLGTIAVVDGDTQGWTKFGLGSPRELINALALESGCFTPHNAAGGQPATYLMNVIAGDKEEVDKGIEMAKGAAVEGLVRSGAATRMLGGGRATYEGSQASVRDAINERLAALDVGLAGLAARGLPVAHLPPAGALYLSVHFDLVERFGNNRAIRKHLLEHAGFAMVPFHAFGTRDDNGWFRLSVGAVGLHEIAPAIERVGAALAAAV